jgi:hypothetical protein
MAPAPGRNPWPISRSIDKADTGPIPDIDDDIRIRSIQIDSGACAFSAIFFIGTLRFKDDFLAIDILITDDLDHGTFITSLFKFNHRNILALIFGYRYLEDKHMYIVFHHIHYPYIVDFSIAIEVEIVDVIAFSVEGAFERLRGSCFFKKIKGTLQAEVVAGETRGVLTGLLCRCG